MSNLITESDLRTYSETLRDYAACLHKKRGIERLLNSQSDINAQRLNTSLANVNKEIAQLKTWITSRQPVIKAQIEKVKKPVYRKILIFRYLYLYKWSKIIELLFSDAVDFECAKDDKYKDKVFYWHKRALAELKKTSGDELTAINKLKQIKILCLQAAGMKCNYDVFFAKVQSLIN